MKFLPTRERETFYLPNFLMDNLIVFFMSGLIAFIIPLFTARRSSSAHVENVLSLYNQHEHTATLRNICMIIGAVIAVIVCSIRLRKFHIYSFEISDTVLTIISWNLLGQKQERKIDFLKAPLKVLELPATRESDATIKITFQSGATVFSTENSKYWINNRDRRTLQSLKESLNTTL